MAQPLRITTTTAAAPREQVPIVEIPNPEHRTWTQTEHDEGAVAPPEWLTLSADPGAVDGSALLRFMGQSRTNQMGAIYELLELAFGPAQMRLLEQARMSLTDLVGISAAVVEVFTEAR